MSEEVWRGDSRAFGKELDFIGTEKLAVKTLRRAYLGAQTAIISLLVEVALKLLL